MKTLRFIMIGLLVASVNSISYSGNDGDPRKPVEEHSDHTEFHDLNDFKDLQAAFNADKGNVRMVALLSASCGYCIKGFRYMRRILEEIPDERLKMYIVWEPMLSGDTRELSAKMGSKGTDPRIVYQSWDPDQISGKAYTAMMRKERKSQWREGNTGAAWDVYFLYNQDVVWKDARPTPPDYWQHQGAGISDLTLDYESLKVKVSELLAKLN